MTRMIFAAIADDFAGGVALAGILRRHGARTLLLFGDTEVPEGYDACVALLTTRFLRANEAVRSTYETVRRLQESEPRQFFSLYSPCFLSSQHGNIGPVCDAMLRFLDLDFTLAVPAHPAAGITQVHGYLFVHGAPLSESSLRDHPMTPMTDANLVRWLQRQTARKAGLLRLPALAGDLRQEATRLRRDHVEIALADALTAADLDALARAFADDLLLTGSLGIASALPCEWRRRGWLADRVTDVAAAASGPALLLGVSSGKQIRIDTDALLDNPERETGRLLKEARKQLRADGRVAIPNYETGDVILKEELETVFGVIAATLADEVGQIVIQGDDIGRGVTAALGIEAAEVCGVAESGATRVRAPGAPELLLHGE